jgi:hypothetical protein
LFRRVALALTAAIWTFPACAQSATASIEGQVINLKTGAPLPDASVTLRGPYAKSVLGLDDSPLPGTRTVSGNRGQFAFHDLAAGNYSLDAGHTGFVSAGFRGERLEFELLPVAEGQQAKDVAIKLAPLGVIAGKVTDEAGKPLQDARITVYQYASAGWRRVPQAGEPTQFGYTNDLGEYRAAVRPGPYIVSAAYPFGVGRLEPDLTPGMGHPTTYYPDAPGPDGAQTLTAVSGETVKADFKLKKAPAYRISGYLTGPQGRIWANACVGIVPKGVTSDALMLGSISTNSQDGSFTMVDIPRGSYVLTDGICASQASQPPDPTVFGLQDLDVSGNVEGLKVAVTPAIQVRGTLKLEGDITLNGAEVMLGGLGFGASHGATAPISSGNALLFEHVLPALHYSARIRGLPAACFVKSVRYGGREVTAQGFQPAADVALEVTISAAGGGQLTGSVTDASGRPARYPLVTAMPIDNGPAASGRSVIGDADGRFVFQALRPGEYLAASWQETVNPVSAGADARILKLYRARGKAVTVQPGPAASVSLTSIAGAELDRARSNP